MINISENDPRYSEEQAYYNRMGWASCPECDKIFYDMQELKEHADVCVYGEQGINPNKLECKWSIQ